MSNILKNVPYCDDEAFFLEEFDQGDGVLFEISQASIDSFRVVIWATLQLRTLLQTLLQTLVRAGQKHHQVWSTNLQRKKRGECLLTSNVSILVDIVGYSHILAVKIKATCVSVICEDVAIKNHSKVTRLTHLQVRLPI